MKKPLLIIFSLLLCFLLYSSWPAYQGLAYRGKVPMLGFNYVDWHSEQTSTSEVFDNSYSDLDSSALDLLSAQQEEIAAPGYTAAVAIDGKLIWAGAVGWADIVDKKAMTTNTQLRIGSTSKALTSAGLAQLVMNGQLTLDTPLKQVFDKLPNANWGNMTARHLASHMSGIPHYRENTEFLGKFETLAGQTHFADVLDSLTLFDQSELQFLPGNKFSYSSFGTVVLSALMQVSAQQPYQELMHDKVFKPIGMQATGVEQEQGDELATFYWQNPEQLTELKPWYDLDLSHRLAGGGWVSTSKDLVRFGQAFINDGYISASVRNEFWSPQKLNNGEVNKQNYGIGWRIHKLDLGDSFKPLTYMHHGGVSAGAQSFLMVIPEYKMSIAVNANIRTKVFWHFGKVSFDLARLFIKQLEQQQQNISAEKKLSPSIAKGKTNN